MSVPNTDHKVLAFMIKQERKTTDDHNTKLNIRSVQGGYHHHHVQQCQKVVEKALTNVAPRAGSGNAGCEGTF